MANSPQSNATSSTKNPQDPGASQSMQPQMQNQVQQLEMNPSQVQQLILSQNMQNNIASTVVPNSDGLTSALPAVSYMSQDAMPNVPAQNPNMQNMANITASAVGNSMGQGVPSNMYANAQRQMPGMQQQLQQVVNQEQQQQSQNSQYDYNEQLQQLEQISSLDSSAQTGNGSGADWQEEIYQKIQTMNEMYYPELNEMYQRMAAKLQQHDYLLQQPKNEQLEKLRFFKVMVERLIMFLQTSKNDIQPSHKGKIAGVHKQIVNILSSNRPQKHVSALQQGQMSQSNMHGMQESQLQQSQISQMHTNDGQMNSQMQPVNVQGSVVTTQQNTLTNVQHGTLSSVSSVSNSRQVILKTSMAPSPMPGDSEKTTYGVSSLKNAGNIVHPSTTAASVPNQSLAIGTPGISTPLLAEFTSPDGTHGVSSTIVSGSSNVIKQPLDRSTKMVNSMSSKALSAAVSDISHPKPPKNSKILKKIIAKITSLLGQICN